MGQEIYCSTASKLYGRPVLMGSDNDLAATASEFHQQGYATVKSFFNDCELESLRKVCWESFRLEIVDCSTENITSTACDTCNKYIYMLPSHDLFVLFKPLLFKWLRGFTCQDRKLWWCTAMLHAPWDLLEEITQPWSVRRELPIEREQIKHTGDLIGIRHITLASDRSSLGALRICQRSSTCKPLQALGKLIYAMPLTPLVNLECRLSAMQKL